MVDKLCAEHDDVLGLPTEQRRFEKALDACGDVGWGDAVRRR